METTKKPLNTLQHHPRINEIETTQSEWTFELSQNLELNWDRCMDLTNKIYGRPEDIVSENPYKDPISKVAKEYELREREVFFQETLKTLNSFSLWYLKREVMEYG
ncbi:MAG TPA: hypothetical protein PKI66_02720 [Methanobacteriaceae archaeon]|nr:hypothetical protein [Methanobacteriaceae archaeon]